METPKHYEKPAEIKRLSLPQIKSEIKDLENKKIDRITIPENLQRDYETKLNNAKYIYKHLQASLWIHLYNLKLWFEGKKNKPYSYRDYTNQMIKKLYYETLVMIRDIIKKDTHS